jgi:hypothetical protein
MPDEHGQLTDADNELIERWWSQHSKDSVICPVCNTDGWQIAGHLVNIQTHAADASAVNTLTYPHIIVTCKFCAHSMFFNAAHIGIAVSPARRSASASDLMEQQGIRGLTQNLANLISKQD